MSKRKIAIFDIDGTVFRSSLLIEIAEVMIEEDLFEKSARKEYALEYQKWHDRKGDYENYIRAVVRAFEKNVKGVSHKDFDRCAKIVIEKYKNRIYRFTRDFIKDLKGKDYFLLAISQSPKNIIDIFCETLGFDKVYGRIYETDSSGQLTGKTVDEELISNKANMVKRAIKNQNLALKGSVGVGDTEGDISFLEMVEEPICFNPNAKLYRYACQKGWKTVVERKDVIYEINC